MGKFLLKNFDISTGFYRFWRPILFAIIGSIALIVMVEENKNNGNVYFVKTILCAWIGMISFLNLQLIQENYNISKIADAIASVIIIVILGLYFYLLPNASQLFNGSHMYTYIAIQMILHLMIAVVVYVRNEVDDFWQYNRRLLMLFVESFFNALVLFLGLCLAITAVKVLFAVKVNFKVYQYLFILLMGIFHSTYFLSRFPTQFHDYQIKQPAKGYLILTQYILTPLVATYMLILYSYGLKILITFKLPNGWVSNLVVWFSVIGIFTYLLSYLNDKFDNTKISKLYKKYFFYSLPIPLIMLFIAIFRRISDYGITEPRYIILMLGLWLLSMTLYFVISKKDNIKIIPLSLIAFIAFTIFGPFNMFRQSQSSQQSRLVDFLVSNELLINEKLQPNSDSLSSSKAKSLTTQLTYLERKSGLLFMNQWLPDSINLLSKKELQTNPKLNHKLHNVHQIADHLNIELKGNKWDDYGRSRDKFYLRSRIDDKLVDISGYNYMTQFTTKKNDPKKQERFKTIIEKKGKTLIIYDENKILTSVDLEAFINKVAIDDSNRNATILQPDEATILSQGKTYKLKLLITSASGYNDNGNYIFKQFSGILFLTIF